MSFLSGFIRVVMVAGVCMTRTWHRSARFVGLPCWRLMGMRLVGQANGLVFSLESLLCIGCLAGLLCNCAGIDATHDGGQKEQGQVSVYRLLFY
jgi:hypothetical protein